MAFTSSTAFQIRRSNDRYEDLQHRTGLYGSFSGSTFTAADADAGLLCNIGDGIPAGGNYMALASDGSAKLYAAAPTDVQRLTNGKDTWAVGVETLGLGIPAGVKDAFLELREGETYAFGPGNFDTIVTTTNKYATVSDGYLVGASALDSSFAGYYFELDTEMGIDVFTESNYVAFSRYNLVLRKA